MIGVHSVVLEEALALAELNHFVRNHFHATLSLDTVASTKRSVPVEEVLKQILVFVHKHPHSVFVTILFIFLKITHLNTALSSVFPEVEGDKVTFIGSTFFALSGSPN